MTTVPTVPPADVLPATPLQVWEHLVRGVRAVPLPVPEGVRITADYRVATIILPDGDTAGVDAWADYLGLGAAAPRQEVLSLGGRPMRMYLPPAGLWFGWSVDVYCWLLVDPDELLRGVAEAALVAA